MNFLAALEGKKTYIIAFVSAAVGLAGAFGVVIPEWANYILAALGVSAVRAAIK